MTQYALIESGNVINVILWDGVTPYSPATGIQAVAIPTGTEAAIGFTFANGTFTAPVAAAGSALTLSQQAAALLSVGLTIISTATTSLNGIYAVDATSIGYVNSELNSILLNATFADGTTTIEWPDTSDALHACNVPQFKTLAAALGAFVSGARKCILGASGATLPAATVTIP